MLKLLDNVYHPDVLSCLADLSNDEVFTPPRIAREMIDILPQELFSDPNAKFLDPACKSGIFLREITERLNEGLKNIIPDPQQRIDHILHNQVYGIGITYLTSLLSRRSVYCSKDASGIYSLSHFDNVDGNIRFKQTKHYWVNGNCKYCGASKDVQDRENDKETHAYEFIHRNIREIENMKFDVIISNPPYQLNDGGNGASAKPIYHLFIEQAKKMQPKYMTMIVPARWYAGGKGLDSFRDNMLNDRHIRELHDYVSASDCFSGVEIKGGVCYFLWERNSKGDCTVYTHKGSDIVSTMERPLLEKDNNTFIRYNDAIQILRKIKEFGEPTFDSLVSPRKPFAFATNFRDYKKTATGNNNIFIYAQKDTGYVARKQVERNVNCIDKWKVFIPEAIGAGNMEVDIVKPIIGAPNTVCSETYVMVGPLNSEKEANNIVQYISTRFFHFLLGLKKITQHTTSKTYSFIPQQDFNLAWTDKMLYKKYNLSSKEVSFIESVVWSGNE